MKGKVITGIALTLLLIGILTFVSNIQPVKASEPIVYIRADGSIDPPTANITSADNITYTLIANIFNQSIFVERDNIVIDGAGRTLQGTGIQAGVVSSERSNVTIQNMKITACWAGIIINGSSGCTISGNTITDNDEGIRVSASINNNSISWNNITNNSESGIVLADSSNTSIYGNTITNNLNFGVGVWSSSNNRFYHNNFTNNTIQANVTSGYVNTWDDGYPSGGNYWSNYADADLYRGPYQNETGNDGIWDHPYVLDTNNADRYPFKHPDMQVIIHFTHSHIGEATTSYNDTDPEYRARIYSGESNATFSTPDANGVRNLTIPLGSGRSNPVYDPIPNNTVHSVSVSDWYGKLYTVDGTADVDIKSMTNDTGTFFWKDGAWHPAGEEWMGDGTPDPAGSAWLTGLLNISVYHGNGTDGPLLGSWIEQIWVTTGYSENTVVEPDSRLNGSYVNATGVPFSPPYVGSVGTWVYTHAKLNIPYWQGLHLDVQGWTEQLTATPPAFMATLFSPANLYVTDPINRHIGAHPTTGELVNEIPGAFYSGPGSHPQRIVIPNPLDGVYDIRIVGTSTGEYTLVVGLATVQKTTTQTYVGNISVGQILQSQAIVSEGEMTSTSPARPVGGISIPVDQLALLAPYIISAITTILVASISLAYIKYRKK